VHDGVVKEFLEGDAKVMSDVITQQVIRPFIIANGGKECHVPTVTWAIFDEEDAGTKATAIASFAKALNDFSFAGYEVENMTQVAESFGLVLKKKDVATTQPLQDKSRVPALSPQFGAKK
jgi:phage gp29-like protein